MPHGGNLTEESTSSVAYGDTFPCEGKAYILWRGMGFKMMQVETEPGKRVGRKNRFLL